MSNTAGKVIAAFIGGAVVGAVAALLLAPQSGAETRAQIKELAKEKGLDLNKEQLDELCSKVIAKVKDYFSSEELEAAVDEVIQENEMEA